MLENVRECSYTVYTQYVYEVNRPHALYRDLHKIIGIQYDAQACMSLCTFSDRTKFQYVICFYTHKKLI